MQFKLGTIRSTKALRWLLCFGIVIIAAAIVGYMLGIAKVPDSQKTSPNQNDQTNTFLRIDSNLGDISIHGEPECDSDKLKQTVPYYCKLEPNQLSTTLTADATLEKYGKHYQFLTWDGCDYTSESKNICMVSARSHQQKSVRATYTEGKPTANQPLAAPKSGTPSVPKGVTPPECSSSSWFTFDADIIAHFDPDYLRDQTMYYCTFHFTEVPTGLTVEGGAAPFSQIFIRCMHGRGTIADKSCHDSLGKDGARELMTGSVRILSDVIVVIGQPMYMFEPHATTHASDDPTYVKWGLDVGKITVTAQPNSADTMFSPYRYTINFPGKVVCTTVADRLPACE